MDEFTTSRGVVVRIGDRFRDRKRTTVRTLRVDRLVPEYDRMTVHCTIVATDPPDPKLDGETRSMNVETLAGRRNFVRVEAVDS